uniref:Uncharacterized protein n=1 Tax=Setaria digitata TaxID=48799 RepID=A0A915PHV1_9BILA
MLAAATHPYGSNNNSSKSNVDKHMITITDVTDQYLKEKDDEIQEGSLVEYCRINHHENAKRQPQICLADKIVKITPSIEDNFRKTNGFVLAVQHWAHLEDKSWRDDRR